METRHYLRALVRLWYVVLASTVVGAALGYLYFLHGTPRYRATAELSLGYSGTRLIDEADARVLAQIRINAFIQLATTSKVLAAAMAAGGVSGGQQTVTASSNSTYSILDISVVSDDPVRAARTANAIGRILPAQLVTLIGPTEGAVRLTPLTAATPPAAAFSPRLKSKLALGVLLGFGLGCLAAALRDVTDRSLRSAEEIEDVAGLPLLGVIPQQYRSRRLPMITHPTSRRAEAYRHVTTSITAVADTARVIAMTSASAREGKTSVVANVAVALQRSGLRVLAVDADLRRPRLASTLEADGDVGLAQVLAGEVGWRSAVRHSDLAELDVLPAGEPPSNPSELLADGEFAELLAELRAEYDIVVIDTPPIGSATDGRLVARASDATVLVGRLGLVTADQVRATIASVGDARVMGFLANRGDPRTLEVSWI